MSHKKSISSYSVGVFLNAALVLVTTTILFAFGVYNYHERSVIASTELNDSAQRVANRLAKSAVQAIWNMDAKQAQEALLSEMDAKQVQSLVIREPDGVNTPPPEGGGFI